jgi:hypothetical protein
MRRQGEQSTAVVELRWTEGRLSERRPIRKHAILHYLDRAQTILIRDISRGGMKIQNAFGLMAGDTIRIELVTRRAFEGTVAWAQPPYCGIKFATELAADDPLLTTHAPRSAEN